MKLHKICKKTGFQWPVFSLIKSILPYTGKYASMKVRILDILCSVKRMIMVLTRVLLWPVNGSFPTEFTNAFYPIKCLLTTKFFFFSFLCIWNFFFIYALWLIQPCSFLGTSFRCGLISSLFCSMIIFI